MPKIGSYLVCHEYIGEVKKFLGQFFEEEVGKYNHENWITFLVSGNNFKVNLMKGADQELTQNMTFEIDVESIEELENFAKKFGCRIESFEVNKTAQKYKYNYIEVVGPKNICKFEISFCEDLKN